MPTSATFGPFTEGVARLSRMGGPQLSASSKTTCEDEYTVVLARGTRPDPATISGLPAIGDALSENSPLVAVRIAFEQTAPESRSWIVRVTYEPGAKTNTETAQHTDFDKRWCIRSAMVDFTMDANTGHAVVNSADEPFDSVPQREMLLPSLSWRRISSVSPATLMEYNGSVNKDAVTILGVPFGIHCARIRFEASKVEDGSSAGKYEYQFYVDGATNLYQESTESAPPVDIGWNCSFLDCGYTCYDDESGARRVILVDDGAGNKVRPSMPQLLCGGSWLQERGNAYFLKYAPYPEKSWSALHLPES